MRSAITYVIYSIEYAIYVHMILFIVDLLTSLHTPAVVVAPPPPPNDGDDVMTASGPAAAEQTDPSEVVVEKPTPLPTGVL